MLVARRPAQRPEFIEVNWRHPLAKKLAVAILARPGGFYDAVSNRFMRTINTSVSQGTPKGLGTKYTGANGTDACLLPKQPPRPVSAFTAAAGFVYDSTNTERAIASWRSNGGIGSFPYDMLVNSTGKLRNEFHNGGFRSVAGATTLSNGRYYDGAIGWSDDDDIGKVWLDGKVDASASFASGTLTQLGTLSLFSHSAANFTGKHAIAYFFAWNDRRLTDRDIAEIRRDPWQLFVRRALVLPGAALQNYSLAAEAGAFSLGGQAAGLRAARRLSAGTGAIALGGQDAGLKAARRMQADPGAIVAGGQPARLLAARVLLVAPGAVTLTGQEAGLSRARLMPAAAGAFVVGGQAVELRRTLRLAASASAFTLSGMAADLTRMKRIEAGTGAFLLAGQAVALRRAARLAAAPAGVVLSGQPVRILAQRRIAAAPGSLQLTGLPAGLRARRVLSAATGTFAITGRAAVFLRSYRAVAEAGVITLSGQAVHLRRQPRLPVQAGVYVLLGHAVGDPALLVAVRVPISRRFRARRKPGAFTKVVTI